MPEPRHCVRQFTLALLEAESPHARKLVSLVQPGTLLTNGQCGARFDVGAFDDDDPVWPDVSIPPFDPSAPLVITATARLTADFAATSAPGH
jgi:hypothetical protein